MDLKDLEKRFDKLDAKLDKIDDKIDTKIDKLDDKVEKRLDSLNNFRSWVIGISVGVGTIIGVLFKWL